MKSMIALSLMLAVAFPASSAPLSLEGKTADQRKEYLDHAIRIDVPYASVLWHGFLGREEAETEILELYSVDLSRYDEFTRRKVVKETVTKYQSAKTEAGIIPVYSVTVKAKLREYDFERKGFPTDISGGTLRINVGNRFVTGKQVMIPDETGYYVELKMPKGAEFISMPEAEAEKLSKRLQSSRELSVTLLFVPKSGLAEESGKEGGVAVITRRGIVGDVVRCEVVFPGDSGYPDVLMWRTEGEK